VTRGAPADLLEVDGTDFTTEAERRGWGDGLPLIPPTPDRVDEMLANSPDVDRDLVLGYIVPRWGELTVERAAISAVMAGCPPAAFPVLLGGIAAMVVEEFNLFAVQVTTHPVAPLLLVNGPIRTAAGIASGYGCLGASHRANVTVGRALRLILLGVGGAQVELIDKATHGYPGKVGVCFAECEEESPWPPFHTTRGFAEHESAVTACHGAGFTNVLDGASDRADDFMFTLINSVKSAGSNNYLHGGHLMIVLSPKHAKVLADGGMSREDVREMLYERAAMKGADFPPPVREIMRAWRVAELGDGVAPETVVRLAASSEDILVTVAGGAGNHTAIIPGFGIGKAVTRSVDVSRI
jgi:hypothetical protein